MKKSLIQKLLATCVVAICSFGAAFAQVHITDRTGLENIKNGLGGSYVLDNDIDLSGSNWVPLGNFTGTLDGAGHVIFGLTITKSDAAAFFSTISGNASVKNLGFENASVIDATGARTAVITAFLEGNAVIENCYIANSTIGGRWCVGSFVGRARNITNNGNAAIRNCYSSAYVYIVDYNGGAGQCGGIIGNIYDGDKMIVENCYFSGIIQRILGNNAEGQIGGIVGWIGQDNAQTINNYTVKNNVNLAPYLLSNYGKHRISSTRSDEVAVNNPAPGPNYSLSTTVVSSYNDWTNYSAIIATDGAQYGLTKKDGENIPDGDANAKVQNFYETTLGWDFTNLWKIETGGSYPKLQWADETRPYFVKVPVSPIALTISASVDLSKYIFSGRGLPLTFTKESTKISLNGSVVSFASGVSISTVETVTVTVQEGSLTPTTTLQISLVPNVIHITNRVGLEAIGTNVTTLSASYILDNDIDLSGANWTPLGTTSNGFTGILDGGGHIIFNMTPTAQDGTAFFTKIQGNAIVKNLGFENANVDGGWNVREAVLTGYMANNALIENCYVANSTVKGRWHVGSFVGRMDGNGTIIRNCYSSAYLSTPVSTQDIDAENTGHVAGIVGVLNAAGCKVENCYFSGIIQRNVSVRLPNEGQTAGIVAWNNNSANIITNNVNLAPYLLSNTGKYRISSVQGNPLSTSANDPSGPNYSLSTTIVSTPGNWENTENIIATTDDQYGLTKRHGLDIPGGDANAKTQNFYKTILGWDFDAVWTINEGNSYPVFNWENGAPHFVVPNPEINLTVSAPVDLSKYIFSGRGLPLTFSTTSNKIALEGSVVSITQSIPEEETVVVSVQEGSLTPAYSLQITLKPGVITSIQTENAPAVNIIAGEGRIQVAFEGILSVKLYSADGALINETMANSVYARKIKQGIYILSVGDKSYKVIVR